MIPSEGQDPQPVPQNLFCAQCFPLRRNAKGLSGYNLFDYSIYWLDKSHPPVQVEEKGQAASLTYR
jgi:hypothetical protein